MADKPFVIALEEHYWDDEIVAGWKGHDRTRPSGIVERLRELGTMRLSAMDEAGIDVQILGHAGPSTQRMAPEAAVRLARGANDRLAESCRAHPKRFAGFAALPTPDPKAAADELERAVTKLGFKGAMVHGPTNGVFFDDQRFWPIFERAAALEVPIYLHPASIQPTVGEIYLKDHLTKFPVLAGAGWGFTIETATGGLRLVLSGVFDKYPKLQIILGHLGEGLPFYVWRLEETLGEIGDGGTFRDYFCNHFYITTSGFFSTAALQCCITELGIDRVMFSVDYPYLDSKHGTDWLGKMQLNAGDKAKIFSGNAQRLMKM